MRQLDPLAHWSAHFPTDIRWFGAAVVERFMDHEHEGHSEPMSIPRCRELLGQEADDLSDLEVDQIRRHADVIAHVIVETFLEQRAPQE